MSRRIAAAVASVLLLAACQDDPQPRFEDASPTSSPDETVTSDEPEVQSAEEFIREWVALHTKMQNTGETREFRSVSAECKACIALADLVDQYYADGGRVETQGWTLRSLKRRPGSGGDTVQYEAKIDSAATIVVRRQGASKERLPAGRGLELFVVRKSDNAWEMLEIAEVAQ